MTGRFRSSSSVVNALSVAASTASMVLGIVGAISQHVREVKPGIRHQLLSLGADGAELRSSTRC